MSDVTDLYRAMNEWAKDRDMGIVLSAIHSWIESTVDANIDPLVKEGREDLTTPTSEK